MDDTKCFQTHMEKFKGIIAISNWQKNNIVKKLDIPEENIILSRNAIYPERFLNKKIDKVPFRFIYSSDPSRGLSYLMKILPIIKERYPETTLCIFANKENIDGDTMCDIENFKEYVFLHNRVNQEQLAIELLKSDVWFYPTNFEETYCISAVEAMVAKCLVVTVELAALKEIVATRGVLCKYPIEENKERLIEKLFFIFENPHLKEHLINKAFDWAAKQNFESLSEEWIDIFKK
jgi:glycosyltransferase involved in cell wall biosynthesis